MYRSHNASGFLLMHFGVSLRVVTKPGDGGRYDSSNDSLGLGMGFRWG